MGNVLKQLGNTNGDISMKFKNCLLIGEALSKLREYYGSFKSICDTFAIEFNEFDQIFGHPDRSLDIFQIWDTDKNGLIDALELFSGLVLFSEAKFEDKLRFLFNIFDFNELNSLSTIVLELLMISCCNATFKILDISESEVNEEDITEFLGKNFNDESRINISQMLKWCLKTPEICEFLKKIKKLPTDVKGQRNVQQNNNQWDQEGQGFQDYQPLGQIISSKKYDTQIDWITTVSKKLQYQNQGNSKTSQNDVYCKINWVYGFRSQNVNHPLEYISPNNAAESERLLYFTACIVVIFYPTIKVQRHYIEHDKEVNCLAVSQKKHLVASGEIGEYPHLHIWDPNTLQNLGVIKGVHQKGIHLLSFFREDEFIASCGIRQNSPIFIHNVNDYSLVLSTFVDQPTIELLTIRNYIGQFTTSISKKKPQTNFIPLQSKYQSKHHGGKKINEYLIKQENQLSLYESMIEDYENSFIVCTSRAIMMLHYWEGHFQKAEIDLNNQTDENISDITCATALRVNDEQPYFKAFQKEEESCIIVITGHSDGQIIIWKNMEDSEREKLVIEDEVKEKSLQNAIVSLVAYQYGIIVATSASVIYLFDLKMKAPMQKIQLTSFPFKLFNYDIADILVAVDKLLVSTIYGDIIEIKFNQKQEWTSSKFQMKTQVNRLNYISKLNGQLSAMCILERPLSDDKIIYVAGQYSVVYGFSLETHEIVDIWTIGQEKPITAIDCVCFEDGGTVFALGCDNGQIYMRVDWEESPKSYDCKKMIMDVKFSSDTFYLVAACQDNQVYIFNLQNKSYFEANPKKLSLEEVPIYIHFMDDNKSFVIGTHQRNQYQVDISDLKSKNILQESDKMNTTIWNLRYPLNPKNFEDSMLPIIIGSDTKVFLAAGESGYLYYWRDQEQLEKNCGGFLKAHSSSISRLLLTNSQDIFFSLGVQDNSIIEWKVDFINDYNDFSKPFREENNNNALSNLEIISKVAQLKEDVLIRELAYTYNYANHYQTDQLKDTFVLFKGSDQKIFQNMIIQDTDKSKDFYLSKRPPSTSLELDFVYGFQAFDKRKSLHYAHIYYDQRFSKGVDEYGLPIKKARYNSKYEILKSLSKNRNILAFQKHKNQGITQPLNKYHQGLSYDKFHENCSRLFVYYTSRIGIVYDPLRSKQYFYEGHTYKITCLVVHHLKYFVATGESSPKPSIHIWNILNCETQKILPTFHKNGIMSMAFSHESSLIVSVGMDMNFSIQITNWKTEEVIAFRNSGQYHIFDVCFNPYNRYEFVTCGSQNITVWEMNGRNFLRKLVIDAASESNYGANCCITCVDYISYYMKDKVDYDIIAGNNYGDLILITCNKYMVAEQRAHQKMINCIKIFQAFGEHILIMTAGEDELIKIWDTKFNLINEIKIKQISDFSYLISNQSNLKEQKNLSAQSLDIFFCCMNQNKKESSSKNPKSKQLISKQKNKKSDESDKQWPIILFGTRNGAIVEATFQLDEQALKALQSSKPQYLLKKKEQKYDYHHSGSSDGDDSEDEIDDTQMQLYGQLKYFKSFKTNQYLQFHCNQAHQNQSKQSVSDSMYNKKIFFSLHPKDQIMVTVGEDSLLCMFDLTNDKPLLIQYLEKVPTCVKFCPDGNTLVIGFTNGNISFYSSVITSKQGKKSEKYEPPKLDIRQLVTEGKTAVLNIEFSNNGYYMAASYDNSRQQKENESRFEKEGSFIHVFKRKQPNKTTSKKDVSNYAKVAEIKQQQIDTNGQGYAVHFMTFSKDSEEDYLLIYNQLFDNYHIRNNLDQKGNYQVWEIKNVQQVKSWEKIYSLSWQNFNFPNSLKAQYQLSPQVYLSEEMIKDQQISQIQQQSQNNYLQQLNKSNLQEPIISSMIEEEFFLVCGSISGDLHLVKQSCLIKPKEGKDLAQQQQMLGGAVKLEQMSLAKSYSAHVSFVNQLEITATANERIGFLFTSGIYDECIFKWKLTQEEAAWDLDSLPYKLDQPDMYKELVTKEQFKCIINEVLPQRQETGSIYAQTEDTKICPVDLKLTNIIGRKAHNSYNNVLYDYDENILYIAGCNLVILKGDQFEEYSQNQMYQQKQQEQSLFTLNLKQEFVKLDGSPKSSFPEIKCFSLSEDKKYLVAGTIEIEAKIIIWDICSRTCIRTLILKNCTMILKVKFAHDNKHICVVALTNEYTMCVYLIDSYLQVILGYTNFPYSLPFKIKDIAFYPNSIYQFITCGVQHMTQWKFNGSIMTYQSMEIEKPNEDLGLDPNKSDFGDQDDQQQDDEEEESKLLKVSFSCVVFVQDVIITSAQDGKLYVWDNNKIKYKKGKANKLYIGSLSAKKDSNLFVSGSIDGKVILWEILKENDQYQINKLQEYSLANISNPTVEMVEKMPEIQIQSTCIGSKYILVGTMNGDIYEFLLPQYSEEDLYKDMMTQNSFNQIATNSNEGDDDDHQVQYMAQSRNIKQNQINLRISCHDQEIPLSIAFADDSRYMFTITQKGFFCVWDIYNSKKIYSRFYDKEAKTLIVCKHSAKIFIAFENEFIILKNDIFERKQQQQNMQGIQQQANQVQGANNRSSIQGIQSNFEKMTALTFEEIIQKPPLKFDTKILDMKLSKGETFLAVAIKNIINIYTLNLNSVSLVCTIQTESQSVSVVEYIDFTVDDNFLLYKDDNEEVSIIDLQNRKKINTIFIEHDIEWCSDGIKISEKTKGVLSQYSEVNRILKITPITQNCIAVTDEMGTIRLFNYPCDRGTGNGYMKCYPDHLNNVNQCVLSPDNRFMVTSSERDRCIFIWQVIDNLGSDDQDYSYDNEQEDYYDQFYDNNNNNNNNNNYTKS